MLSPLEFIQRLAALIPPPRAHRHPYHGILATDANTRAAVTVLAQEASNGALAQKADLRCNRSIRWNFYFAFEISESFAVPHPMWSSVSLM